MTRVHCTSPTGERKPPVRPFAALPHDIGGDPTLSPTAKTVLLALLYWARAGDACWPSDRSIGGRVNCSVATVQRQLRGLEARGLVARERADNPTGRLIVLVWRRAPAPRTDDRPPRSRVIDSPHSGMIDKEDVTVKRDPLTEKREVSIPGNVNGGPGGPVAAPTVSGVESPAPAPPMAPRESRGLGRARLGPDPAELARWLTSGDPVLAAEAALKLGPRPPVDKPPAPATTGELLARLRESPERVAQAAELLAQEFDDRKSWAGFHARCREAWSGLIEPGDLVAAYGAATSGQARNPGAVFMGLLGRAGPGSSRPRPR